MSNGDYDNTNRGVLFKNANKENENHPDYKGRINVEGEERWLSAWIRVSQKDGTKFLSIAVGDEIEPQQEEEKPKPKAKPAAKKTAGRQWNDL